MLNIIIFFSTNREEKETQIVKREREEAKSKIFVWKAQERERERVAKR